jgi:hypothetical protein
MTFLLILTLLIGSQALFSFQLIQTGGIAGLILAIIQLVVFATSIVLMRRNFRGPQTTDYRKGFYAMGAMIATGVPTLGYFVFGLLFLITGFPVMQTIGWAIAGCMFIAILAGIFWGRWNWKTHTIPLSFEHLPAELDGLRIVQISDIHVGSFFNQHDRVQKAIDMINALKPDYVLFTGDLVNNITAEMHGWEPLFLQIEAKIGKYSILGNHDYGDYVKWEEDEKKRSNLEALIDMHRPDTFRPHTWDAVWN